MVMPDGGFEAPKVLPNPLPASAPAIPATEPAPAVPAPGASPEDLSEFVPALDMPEDKKDDETTQPSDDAAKVEGEVETDPKVENFKALRTIVKEVKAELQTTKSESAKLKKQLEDYQTGVAVPEVLQEKEARIAQLEPLEHLHALRTSRLYQDEYIKPLTTLQGKLQALLTEYDLPPESLEEMSAQETQADLNRWLSEHFDPLGAQDARDIVRQVQTLRTEAEAAEQAPKTALEKLIKDAQAAEETQQKERLSAVHQASRKGWVSSLEAHKASGLLPELIFQPGDDAHNNTYVKPVLTKAGMEYGKIVKHLFDNGLRTLPDELAFALANMCQLAHATGVQATIRDSAMKHAQTLAADAMAGRKFNRPAVGSTSGMNGTSANAPAERMTPEQAARMSREHAAVALKK